MKRALALLLVLAPAVSCAPRYCTQIPSPRIRSNGSTQFRAGVYAIEFQATAGSHDHQAQRGHLWIVPIDRAVRSDDSPFYGWTDVDLTEVGAPLCPGEPSPSSNDPLKPGALVSPNSDGSQRLVIGNCGNVYRPGMTCFDGCGIYLEVDHADSSGFQGRWGGYGIVVDGCGYFRASIESE